MKRLIIFAAAAVLTGCTAKEELAQTGVKTLSWLEGKWVSQDGDQQFVEEWHDAGLMLTGRGKTIHGTDTTDMEQLTIMSDTLGLTYVVDLPNNRTVRFVSRGMTATETYKNLSYSESTIVTFVNDTNDFPREITYRKQNADSLYITLTGSEAGKPLEMTFRMRKVK